MTSTLHRRQDLIDEVDAFMQQVATHKEVASAAIKCPAALYDEGTHDSLPSLRYRAVCLPACLRQKTQQPDTATAYTSRRRHGWG